MLKNKLTVGAFFHLPIYATTPEKLETILSKGSRNSRMKDFHDLLLLLRDKNLRNSKNLRESIKKTFANRGTILKPIQFEPSGYLALQKLWTSHLLGLGDVTKELQFPTSITTAIDIINSNIEFLFT